MAHTALTTTQKQAQTLSAFMHQGLKLLHAPIAEITQIIHEAVEQNPTLEYADPPSTVSFDALTQSEDAQAPEYELDLSDPQQATDPQSAQLKHDRLIDHLRTPISLQDHLLQQAALLNLSPAHFERIQLLIGNIDPAGYFTGSLPDLEMILDIRHEELLHDLATIQQFDPPGIGARTPQESLSLQIHAIGPSFPDYAMALRVVSHLQQLVDEPDRLMQTLSITPERLATIRASLKRLSPMPGAAFSQQILSPLTPEVIAAKSDGRWTAIVDTQWMPKLRLNAHYRAMLADNQILNQADQAYLQKQIKAAQSLIDSIHIRGLTLQRVSQAIIDHQLDFFDHGMDALKPLTQQTLAQELDLHPSTISRAVHDKTIKTPRGIYPLSIFFSMPQESTPIPALIRSLIQAESPDAPLSDQAIAHALSKQGIPIARRTVSKYRTQLMIPSQRSRARSDR